MMHTSCAAGLRAGRAVGYTDDGRTNTAGLPPNGTSAGGCYSTAADLLRFAYALVTYRLLDPALTKAVTTSHVAAPGGGYGYGFGIRHGVVWHDGGAPGVAAELDVDPRTGLTLVILENRDPTTLREDSTAIRREIGMP